MQPYTGYAGSYSYLFYMTEWIHLQYRPTDISSYRQNDFIKERTCCLTINSQRDVKTEHSVLRF